MFAKPLRMLRSVAVVVLGLGLALAGLTSLTLSIGRSQCQIATRNITLSADRTYRDRHKEFPVKTIRANGLNFSYIEAGQGPLVLMLHGFPDNARTWEEAMLRLAGHGFRAVAVFNRGYYPTDMPADGDYSVASMAKDVLSLIVALGEKTAVLIGQDWGASIAYAAANTEPSAISKLIVVAIPHPRVIERSLALFRCSPHFLVLPFGALSEWYAERNDFAYIEYLYHYWSPSWSIPKDLIDEVKSDFSRPGRLPAALQYYRFVLSDRLDAVKTELYRKKTRVPALVMVGEEDIAYRIGMFARIGDAFSGPLELAIVPHAGHFLHREQPEVFFDRVIAFLKN